MIDFLFGSVFGGLAVFLFYHFGPQATKAFATNLEQRIKTMVTDTANSIIAEVQALPAALAAQSQAALTEEQTNHADDLSAIDAAVKAITPAPAQ